jgi:hypothetical protein
MQMFGGVLLASLGAVMSLVSYFQAVEKGGSYFIWTGALIAGGAMAIRAWARTRAIRRTEQPLDRESSGAG